jgi:hypothetical protein
MRVGMVTRIMSEPESKRSLHAVERRLLHVHERGECSNVRILSDLGNMYERHGNGTRLWHLCSAVHVCLSSRRRRVSRVHDILDMCILHC